LTGRFFANPQGAKDDTAALLKGQYQMSNEDATTGLAVTTIAEVRASSDRATRKRVKIPASASLSVWHVQALHRAAKQRP